MRARTPFLWQARVYWEDTDAGGVVYYANYLKFIERARSEWLRTLGYSQRRVQGEEGLVFTVVGLQARYRRPARLEDLLCVSCVARLEGRTSVVFGHEIWREEESMGEAVREVLFDAEVRVACVDEARFRPRRLPTALREAIA